MWRFEKNWRALIRIVHQARRQGDVLSVDAHHKNSNVYFLDDDFGDNYTKNFFSKGGIFELCHHVKYQWRSSFLVKLQVSSQKLFQGIGLFTGIFQVLLPTFPEHLFFRAPPNGCFCNPCFISLILIKGFRGSDCRFPGASRGSRGRCCRGWGGGRLRSLAPATGVLFLGGRVMGAGLYLHTIWRFSEYFLVS